MEDPVAPQGEKIGGWLVLPLLGLIISPFVILYNLYNEVWDGFAEGYLSTLVAPFSQHFDGKWAALIYFILFGSLTRLGLCAAALWLFLKKSRRTPVFVICWLVYGVFYLAVRENLWNRIPELAKQPNPDFLKSFFRAVLQVAIWTPYFLTADRAKHTFVE